MKISGRTCKLVSKKDESGCVIAALISNNCGGELAIAEYKDDSYIYTFFATSKEYDTIAEALKEKVKVCRKDVFGRELYQEP